MKKMLLIIYLVMISFICIGCESPPDKGWELWISGTVDKTSIQINEYKKTFIIEFEGNLEFKSSRFYNFKEVEEKTKGSVYRWSGTRSYYMWVPSDDIDILSKMRNNIYYISYNTYNK